MISDCLRAEKNVSVLIASTVTVIRDRTTGKAVLRMSFESSVFRRFEAVLVRSVTALDIVSMMCGRVRSFANTRA